jgi:arabinogalactan endo-1,4-beta-galactosidase
LTYTPAWARKSGCTNGFFCAPADPAKFAKFSVEAVKRYAPQGIHTWEIWNEPNFGKNWGTQGNVAGYAELLKQTSVAIKAQDPTAFIVLSGTGPAATNGEDISPLDFLEQFYQLGTKSYFDAVGFHPYSFPVPPTYNENWNAWNQISGTTRSMRSIMAANGDASKPIWLTEYGAPTGGPGIMASKSNYHLDDAPTHVTEELQSIMMTEAITAVSQSAGFGPMFWYSYIDQGTSSSDNENFFGILRADGSKKPTYTTLQTLLK